MKSDTQLKQDIENELRWDPSVHAERIGVSVNNGVVELDGHVDSYYEKWSAERAALRVGSVKAIADELKVDLPNSATRTDEDIARAATNYLEWNDLVPDTVQAKVTDGWVTPRRHRRLAVPERGHRERRPELGWREGRRQSNNSKTQGERYRREGQDRRSTEAQRGDRCQPDQGRSHGRHGDAPG